jgi:hypothetical protein
MNFNHNCKDLNLIRNSLKLPNTHRNLLTLGNVETIISSSCLDRPKDLLTKKHCPAELGDQLAWQWESETGSPAWISVRLKKPMPMDSLVLVTLPAAEMVAEK